MSYLISLFVRVGRRPSAANAGVASGATDVLVQGQQILINGVPLTAANG